MMMTITYVNYGCLLGIPVSYMPLSHSFCGVRMWSGSYQGGISSTCNPEQQEADTNEDEMEDITLDNEMERHWNIFFEYNDRGRYYKKYLLHTKSCDVYMIDKLSLIKGGYFVEVSCYDGERVI